MSSTRKRQCLGTPPYQLFLGVGCSWHKGLEVSFEGTGGCHFCHITKVISLGILVAFINYFIPVSYELSMDISLGRLGPHWDFH